MRECYNYKATTILNNPNAVCWGFARVDIAMLRSVGLATREASGCSIDYQKISCTAMNIFKQQLPNTNQKYNGAYVLNGNNGLHSWVEVWLPDTGWTIADATAGYLFGDSCTQYVKYFDTSTYDNDNTQCSITDYYYNKCQTS